jgi:hypothetical protein
MDVEGWLRRDGWVGGCEEWVGGGMGGGMGGWVGGGMSGYTGGVLV